MKLKCPREGCGHVWEYYGDAMDTTSCPKCGTTMSIKKAFERARGQTLSLPERAVKTKRKKDKNMSKCLVCGMAIEPFMSFGKMPLANGFLTKEEFEVEYFFELKVAFCQNCNMLQLTNPPQREMMFNENYPFFSGTSELMALHFEEFANMVKKEYPHYDNPFVVEIGSNDGIMLKHFANSSFRHLGIEPSSNVAEVAIENGINTICEFFDEALAKKIVRGYGHADVFLGANVMCHIPYLHSIIEGIKILLKTDGVAIFEDPYLGAVLRKTSYDQIYDEHTFLFSVTSIKYLFEMHDMELIDVESQKTHGGSMRYTVARKGMRPVTANVKLQLLMEKLDGFDNMGTYDTFKESCERSRRELITLLENIKNEGKRVVGYAATSKSTIILNYCGLSTKDIEFICDTTPIKQGKFSPGMHIPVLPHEEFTNDYPDYALLFAYNHMEEIMAKEQKFKDNGGKWIVYVPTVGVLE